MKAAAELGFDVAAPSPELSERSDGEGVVVTGTDAGDVWRESRNSSGLVGVAAHADGGGGQAQRPLASVPKAHHHRVFASTSTASTDYGEDATESDHRPTKKSIAQSTTRRFDTDSIVRFGSSSMIGLD